METTQKHTITQFELSKWLLQNLNRYEISPTSKLVLMILADCYNPNKTKVFPKQKTISNQLGISERSVVRAINELKTAGLLIYERKYQNRYEFTSKFFEPVKMSSSKCKIVRSENDKLSGSYIEQKKGTKKEQNVFSFNELTSFQKQYTDVFEQLSEYDLKKYKMLKGYEKADYLKNKRKEHQKNNSLNEILEVKKINSKSPMNDRETALKYIEDCSKMLENRIVRMQVQKIKDIWGLY